MTGTGKSSVQNDHQLLDFFGPSNPLSNDVIWKHELNVQMDFRNRFVSRSVPVSKPFNGSGGISISES